MPPDAAEPPNKTITLPLDAATRAALEGVQRATGIKSQRDAIRLALSFTARSFPGKESKT